MSIFSSADWFEDYAEDGDQIDIDEYDITATPNDFNLITLNSFIETGAIRVPGFQRNYVWDQVRASKLIESLILGIPVPQLFLYEQGRNRFLVIDGQQRLMSIYYFFKRRFPRRERRVELRGIFDQEGKVPDSILYDDRYFDDFTLKLSERLPNVSNKFSGLNYHTLNEYKTQFDLRPIRNIVVKQNSPSDDDSSMYEVFNRLNTGGVNLRPQEIRTSMYHSDFYEMLYKINMNQRWRVLLGSLEPDIHVKDIEIMLRGFAMLIMSDEYAPSLVRFLNKFSKRCESQTKAQNEYLSEVFDRFISSTEACPDNMFINSKSGRFNVALYEAVFAASCGEAFSKQKLPYGSLDPQEVANLERDGEFQNAALQGTTQTGNVRLRLTTAKRILSPLLVE